MIHKAVIYIRTSSETQGGKSSPNEQEDDCQTMAKENFDPKIAPIRAWVAQMEFDSMKERMEMGVKARLKAGKANTGQDRYAYIRIGGNIHIVEEEKKWVRQIFGTFRKLPLCKFENA